jgi:nitrogenase-associated protein
MASIVFYEKPGCINNTRQKEMLLASGHLVEARNLLTQQWSRAQLLRFFKSTPVVSWFNSSAPDIKSGKIKPSMLDEQAALELMLNSPILIRRPLMSVGGEFRAGFEIGQVDQWIGLGDFREAKDLETCPKLDGHDCRDPVVQT